MTTVFEKAQQRADRLYPRSTGFRSAYVKGARAALQGLGADACPYRRRKGDTTWRRSWWLAWIRGHQSITRDQERR